MYVPCVAVTHSNRVKKGCNGPRNRTSEYPHWMNHPSTAFPRRYHAILDVTRTCSMRAGWLPVHPDILRVTHIQYTSCHLIIQGKSRYVKQGTAANTHKTRQNLFILKYNALRPGPERNDLKTKYINRIHIWHTLHDVLTELTLDNGGKLFNYTFSFLFL